MPRVLVPLAEGCEEIEAVTIIDILRRANFEVVAAGLTEGPVRASRGVTLVPDTTLDKVLHQEFDAIALPGGGPGAEHLRRDHRILGLLRKMAGAGKITAAVCAAPTVLAAAGLLDGKRATSYPGELDRHDLPGTTLVADPVVVDGTVVTSRGPGTAMDFALALVELLDSRAKRDEVEARLQRP